MCLHMKSNRQNASGCNICLQCNHQIPFSQFLHTPTLKVVMSFITLLCLHKQQSAIIYSIWLLAFRLVARFSVIDSHSLIVLRRHSSSVISCSALCLIVPHSCGLWSSTCVIRSTFLMMPSLTNTWDSSLSLSTTCMLNSLRPITFR